MTRSLLLALSLLAPACSTEVGEVAAASEEDISSRAAKSIFTGASSSRSVAADEAFVYFTDSAAIEVRKVPIGGGASTLLWKGRGMDSLGFITVDQDTVYFTEDERILAVPKTGGYAKELVRLKYDGPGMLATDDAYVYWGGVTDFAVGYDAYIKRVKKTGGAIETVYEGYDNVDAIVVHDGYVYFTGDENVIMNPRELLMRAPVGGGSHETIVPLTGYVHALTGDESSLYFALADGSWKIQSLPYGGPGATPKTLIDVPLADTNEPHDLAVSAKYVYWASPGTFDFSKSPPDNMDAHVYRTDKTKGGRRSTMASSVESTNTFALAGDCPVWASHTAVQTTSACAK